MKRFRWQPLAEKWCRLAWHHFSRVLIDRWWDNVNRPRASMPDGNTCSTFLEHVGSQKHCTFLFTTRHKADDGECRQRFDGHSICDGSIHHRKRDSSATYRWYGRNGAVSLLRNRCTASTTTPLSVCLWLHTKHLVTLWNGRASETSKTEKGTRTNSESAVTLHLIVATGMREYCTGLGSYFQNIYVEYLCPLTGPLTTWVSLLYILQSIGSLSSLP